MASGHVNRIKRPNTWLHRPMLQNVKKALANPEPSTHGTNRTNRDVRCTVYLSGEKRTWLGEPYLVEIDAVDGAHSAASKCHRVVALEQTTLRGAVHG
jgi:hypothetical protein